MKTLLFLFPVDMLLLILSGMLSPKAVLLHLLCDLIIFAILEILIKFARWYIREK